jgi:hypothetical protein
LEVAIFDDRVLFALTLKLLFALHEDFIGSFASWDGIAVSSENRCLLGLPSPATGGFAEGASAPERVRIELAVRAFKILGKCCLGLAERDAAVEIGAPRGCRGMEACVAALAADRLGLASKGCVDVTVRVMGGGGISLEGNGRGGGGCCGRDGRSWCSENGDGVGEHAPEGGARELGGMRGGWASVNLVKAVVANTGSDDGRGWGLEDGEWDVAWWMEEREIGGVEQGGGARGARVAEHATAFAAMVLALEERERNATVEVVAGGGSGVGLPEIPVEEDGEMLVGAVVGDDGGGGGGGSPKVIS